MFAITHGQQMETQLVEYAPASTAWAPLTLVISHHTDTPCALKSLDFVSRFAQVTTDFSHEHRREFERLKEEAEDRGAELWGACPEVEGY